MNRAIRISLLVLALGLIMTVLSVSDTYSLLFRHKKLLDKSHTDIENSEMISGDIDYVIADVGEGKMTKKLFGIPYGSVKSHYYLILLNNGSEGVGGYVLIESSEGSDRLYELYAATKQMLAGFDPTMPEPYKLDAKATEVTADEEAMLDSYFTGKTDPSDPQLVLGENWEASMYALRETNYTLIVVQICVSLFVVIVGAVLLIVFNRMKTIEGATVYVNEFPGELMRPETPESETDAAPEETAGLPEKGE